MSDETGLRARKKAATRRQIADGAARLFGRHGFENVTMADVARAANVSEQTVYNYFPTKRSLALDRVDELVERFGGLVHDRPAGTSPAAALREAARAEVERQRTAPRERARGDLPALAAASPSIRRLALEAFDRYAQAIADAIVATTPDVDPMVAKTRGTALMSVFQQIVEHAGRRYLEGASGGEVADELAASVEAAFDDLEGRF